MVSTIASGRNRCTPASTRSGLRTESVPRREGPGRAAPGGRYYYRAMGIEAAGESSFNHGDRIEALRELARRAPGDPDAWRALADACFRAGLSAEADAAYQRATLVAVNDPVLRAAALALAANRLDIAERLINPHLKANPPDVAAIRMLAELAARIGRLHHAEPLPTRAVEPAPG